MESNETSWEMLREQWVLADKIRQYSVSLVYQLIYENHDEKDASILDQVLSFDIVNIKSNFTKGWGFHEIIVPKPSFQIFERSIMDNSFTPKNFTLSLFKTEIRCLLAQVEFENVRWRISLKLY